MIGPSAHPVVEPYAGGLESFVGTLTAGLRERGHDVTLFAAAGSAGADTSLSFPGVGWHPSEIAAGDTSMPAARFMADHHAHLRLMTALRRDFRGRLDVVHNNSLHYLPLSMAETLPFPLLTTLHTPPTPWLESAILAGGGGAGADTVFTCVSASTARQWTHVVAEPRVIPNGVPVHQWPLGPGGGNLLWFGRICPEKAPHLAVAAATRAGRDLDLVGPISDPAYFEALIRPELGDRVGSRIRYLGHLGGAELADRVGRAAAVLVTPVWDEPFGLVIAEAAMCGTPTIAFDRGGVSETLGAGGLAPVGLTVPEGDVDAMAAAIGPATALDRAAVRARAVRRFGVDRVVDAYEALYREVVAGAADLTDQVDEAAS
ncbi:glycosyltransferase [Kineococcus gynurae]|uniref:Glycosyltransferase n=1 Tax=Kineococcus gynurae TaxID=452979 RepID=A0ABV5LNJ8_9ACTN